MTYHINPPEQNAFPPFVKYQALLSPPECKAVIEAGEQLDLTPGTIGNGGGDSQPQVVTDYRCVQNGFLKPLDPVTGDLIWLFERLRNSVVATNNDFFRFDISGFSEGITFLKYEVSQHEGEPGGHYKWHQDFGGGPASLRKLTLVTQLSNADEYTGCNLSFFTDMEFNPEGVSDQGDLVIFPSWTPHMVSELKSGTRYALAAWVAGPQFR